MDIIDTIKHYGFIYLKFDELCDQLSKVYNEDLQTTKLKVNDLIAEGDLFLEDNGRLSISKEKGYYKAVLTLNRKGFGFAAVEGFSDFFIPAFAINGAFDGDNCLVEITNTKGGDNIEGRVVRVLKRNTTHVVGTFITGNNRDVVFPDDDRLPQIRIFKSDNANAKNNEKVLVELDLDEVDNNIMRGKVVEILGQANTPKAEQLSIIRSFKLTEKFDQATINEAMTIPTSVSVKKYKNRRDFTNLLTITIDGEDAQDFDDAISVEDLEDGGHRVYVHIADVSNYVTEGSALDREALKRGTSVYFPNMVIPMLPKELSNGICSLQEDENRLTLSVIMDFDKSNNLVNSEICESVIKSRHRMTYTEITNILAGDELLVEKFADVYNQILYYQQLSESLKKQRLARGEIRFNIPEPYILENQAGEIVSIENRVQDEAHEIIESLMIKANEVVAEFGWKNKLPLVYRVHEKPDSEKVNRLSQILRNMGVANQLELDGDKPVAYQKIINKIAGTPKERILTLLTLRTMMKARYSPTCLGHFGIASEYYCHFTSPIRRYPDLMVHRVIKQLLNGVPKTDLQDKYKGSVERISDQCSATERNADEAERQVDDYKKCVYMSKFIGQEFVGTISGVQEFGLFVELDNGVEGMVKIDDLPFDEYVYDDLSLTLYGQAHHYTIGDTIKIVVVNVNMRLRQIDFDISGVEKPVKNRVVNLNKKEKQPKTHDKTTKKPTKTKLNTIVYKIKSKAKKALKEKAKRRK